MTDEKTPVATTPATAFELPGKLGRYEILSLLGRGGMGAVFKARQTDLDRLVCIKVIAPELAKDATLVGRFHREARSAARVSSDNVVQVHEVGTEDGIPFIAMELVEGRSVAELLKERGKLAPDEAVRIATFAARGLEAAHKASVLHRDVKPANILVANDGRVKVVDFGLAKIESVPVQDASATPLSIAGEIVGTPDYIAPEQAEGSAADGRTDLYQLGVTLYEMLTGVRPFQASTPLATLALVLTATAPAPRSLVPNVPPAVEAACQKLMAKEAAARPANATEAIALLEGLSRPQRRPAEAAPTVPRLSPVRPAAKAFVVTKRAPEPSGGMWAVLALVVALSIPAALFAKKLLKQTPPVPVPAPAPVPVPVPDSPEPPPEPPVRVVAPPAPPPRPTAPPTAGVPPAEAEFRRADEKAKAKDWDGAILSASKAIELDSKLEPAWTLRALARLNKGEVVAAEADLSRATELAPANPNVWMNRAAARTALRDLKGAIDDYGKAIDAGTRDARVWYQRAVLRRENADVTGALEDYKRFVELAPNDPLAVSAREAIEELKR